MGGSASFIGLTEDILEEYVQLTYLSRSEILTIYKMFKNLTTTLGGSEEDVLNLRYNFEHITTLYPALKYNPFRHRICNVFSSQKDGYFSFEDMLDLCSAMSDNCPDTTKALWAFRIFDFNEDGEIDSSDLIRAVDCLTSTPSETRLSHHEKTFIAEKILSDTDLQKNGSIGQLEFKHALLKIPEFIAFFRFKI